MTMSNSNPNKPAVTVPPNATRGEREAAIAKAAEAARLRRAGTPAPGSREARVAEATASGVVKPSKADRPAKIPADKNAVRPRVDDTATVTEGDVTARKKAVADAARGADAELDEAVRPKKAAKDPSMLTVGDVARELGLDPKRARARLRASGASAVEGRWPKVKRGSKEHDALVATLSASESRDADEADAT